MVVRLSSQAVEAGYRVEFFDVVDSTNGLAGEFARNGDNGKLWIVANEQVQGRGRRGNKWISMLGNFFGSLLLVEQLLPFELATLGFVAGVSLIEAIEQHAPNSSVVQSKQSLKLKWPNDLIVGNSKLSGILLELVQQANNKQAIIIGIGCNIVSSPAHINYSTTALKTIGYQVDASKLFESLSATWAINYALWDNGKNLNTIREKWLQHAAYLGERINIMVDGELISGVFETIDDQCQLVIYQDNGSRKTISAGEVYLTNQVFSAPF